MLIHVQITTFWLQKKLEQRKQRQAANNMNKLKMFETKQVTPDLTKNLNPFFVQGPEPISSLDLEQVVKISNFVAPTKNATVGKFANKKNHCN